ncbi:hypothetical protein [Streptomyces liangshanensis]|uniref:hypothetical protein n=1 Tax=Streptomyces liangshanensis TaxID=2717324 RepID=UPI0036DEB988
MRRLEKGQPIRDAMKAAGLAIPALAARTQEIDPETKGLSPSYIGFIVGKGATAREECSDRAAQLVAVALDREVGELFDDAAYATTESTSTRRSDTGDRPNRRRAVRLLPDHLMDQEELAAFLRKSMSWIDKEIQTAREQGRVWPGLHYVGRSRRFDAHEVLKGQRQQRATA